MRAYTAQKLKSENREQAFRVLIERRTLSKSELSALLGVSPPTAGKIIDAFLKKGLVREAGPAPSEMGRPPAMVELNADAFYYIGVVIEGRYTKAGIVNLAHELVGSSSWKGDGGSIEETLRNEIPRGVHDLTRTCGIDPGRIMGVGIGLPGICDIENRVVRIAPLIGMRQPTDIGAPLDALAQSLGCPVIFDNDTNMAALGEHILRPDSDDMLFITLGTGLGAALLVGGHIIRGSRNRAGEIGYSRFSVAGQPLLEEAGWLESQINLEAVCRASGVADLQALAALPDQQKQQAADAICALLAPCVANLALALDIALIPVAGLLPDALGLHFLQSLNRALPRCTPFDIMAVAASHPQVDIVGAAGATLTQEIDHLLAD